MRDQKRVVLGLSGGVDSAVAAKLLKKQGYTVLGVYLKSRRCRDESAAARQAANQAGIDFCTIDISDSLEGCVVEPFIRDYLRGRTPNPCIYCNPAVKFPMLLKAANGWGAQLVATGHYARLVSLPTYGGSRLIAAMPCANDQSYMLYRLPMNMLQHLIFPLGELADKDAVRELAAAQNVSACDKPDSMEICFIPDNDRVRFIEREAGAAAVDALRGEFVDQKGNVLGRHEGIHRYTVGQRRGLAMAFGERAYVTAIDRDKRRVVLGNADDVVKNIIRITECIWHIPVSVPFPVHVRVRHSRGFTDGMVYPESRSRVAYIKFKNGVRAPAPGQSAVCYADIDGVPNVMIGGGYIDA